MRTLQPVALLVLSCLALGAFAQTTGEPTRGNTPPGMSQDGSRPADGAIRGGSILPGESGGLPNTGGTAPNSAERVARCEELNGKLREECLKDEASPATGSTMPNIRRTPKEIDYMDREKPGTK